MKKSAILIALMLPMALLGQSNVNKNSLSVGQFFKYYNDYTEYHSIEVTEDMFKLFSQIEEADSEMLKFFSKLKFIRVLEYTGITNHPVLQGAKGEVIGVSSGTSGKATEAADSGKKSSGVAATCQKSPSLIYRYAMNKINFTGWTLLIKSKDGEESMAFYKRQSRQNGREFLLIQGNMFINICGDIDITHLYQIDEILEALGEIFPI